MHTTATDMDIYTHNILYYMQWLLFIINCRYFEILMGILNKGGGGKNIAEGER